MLELHGLQTFKESVVQGSVLFVKNPAKITERVVNTTYGAAVHLILIRPFTLTISGSTGRWPSEV